MAKAKPGMAIMIGLDKKAKPKEGEEISETSVYDAAIEEMFSLAAQGDVAGAAAAFKDMFQALHDKSHGWSGEEESEEY